MSRILWVDDDYQVIRGLIRPLEKAGYIFDNVSSIAAALQRLHCGITYDLAIIDILLPLDETAQESTPECIKAAGTNAGEGLIAYMRDELGLRIPIIVMSVLGSDSELQTRLEPYEVSYILKKGELRPTQAKGIVEEVLDETSLERATLLNLRSKKPKERKIGLLHAAQMKSTPKLHKTLVRLVEHEVDPELRQLAFSILENYPPYVEPDLAFDTSGLEDKVLIETVLPDKYDVFLAHNSIDKPVVEVLAQRLVDEGLQPWLDKWNLIPGAPWQKTIKNALDACRTIAVFIGRGDLSPWQHEEMRLAIETRAQDDDCRVIPVLLPGAPDPEKRPLPRFLSHLTWVDFRSGLDDECFRQLVAGIRGVVPGSRRRQDPIPTIPLIERKQTPPRIDSTIAEEQASLQRQLAQHYRTLNRLRERAAIYVKGETPFLLLDQIEDKEMEIQRLQEKLNALQP